MLRESQIEIWKLKSEILTTRRICLSEGASPRGQSASQRVHAVRRHSPRDSGFKSSPDPLGHSCMCRWLQNQQQLAKAHITSRDRGFTRLKHVVPHRLGLPGLSARFDCPLALDASTITGCITNIAPKDCTQPLQQTITCNTHGTTRSAANIGLQTFLEFLTEPTV